MATFSDYAQRGLDQASGRELDRRADLARIYATDIDYAKLRRSETGQAYLVSAQGHVMYDCPHNRQMIEDDLGGVIFRS